MYAATIVERAIRSPDGASVRARVFLPRRDEPAKPVGLPLPAMGARASFYEPLALALAEQGMSGESSSAADRAGALRDPARS